MLKHRSPSRSYQAVHDSEGRRQQIAQFEASLSALRKELNLWWDRNGGGAKSSDPPQLLAIRSRVRESAQLEREIHR
jgi:hypothetical protein